MRPRNTVSNSVIQKAIHGHTSIGMFISRSIKTLSLVESSHVLNRALFKAKNMLSYVEHILSLKSSPNEKIT